MPGVFRGVVLYAALCLAGCRMIAQNSLSADDTADLHFTSRDVRVGPTAVVICGNGEDADLKSRELSLSPIPRSSGRPRRAPP